MSSWSDLEALRRQGLRPGFPVMVTTNPDRMTWTLAEIGAMVIHHRPGDVFPVELLAGLRVWLFLGSCDRAQAVVRTANRKGVEFALEAWCECARSLDPQPVGCSTAAEWWEAA
jgi:hypothetical protein